MLYRMLFFWIVAYLQSVDVSLVNCHISGHLLYHMLFLLLVAVSLPNCFISGHSLYFWSLASQFL